MSGSAPPGGPPGPSAGPAAGAACCGAPSGGDGCLAAGGPPAPGARAPRMVRARSTRRSSGTRVGCRVQPHVFHSAMSAAAKAAAEGCRRAPTKLKGTPAGSHGGWEAPLRRQGDPPQGPHQDPPPGRPSPS
eukprot:6725934-Alexandrium_andersonii.AAC.1